MGVNDASPYVLDWVDIDDTVGVAFDTVIVLTTDVAAEYLSSPAWAAVNVHEPEDTSVSVEPDTVHTEVVPDVTVGVSPDDAENDIATPVAEYVWSPGDVKVIVCDALLIVKVRVTFDAAS